MLALTSYRSAPEGFGMQARTHFLITVRVFYPNASSNCSSTTTTAYRKHETSKKREYAQRVRDVEHGVFTPLAFSATGGMGREAATFYKRLADGILRKPSKSSTQLSWDGSVAAYHSPFCVLLFSAFAEADHLATALSMN